MLAKTSLFFIIMCSIELVAEHADTPPPLLRVINILFVIAASIQAAIWARELILGVIQHRVGDESNQRSLGSALGIIRLLVTVALFAIAIIVILDNLGVNVTGLVAGLGIGGIAIGLAAQGIFYDLFAALSIIFDKPFRRGDGISFEQHQRHGRADRPQDHPRSARSTARRWSISNANAARQAASQFHQPRAPPHPAALRPGLPDASRSAAPSPGNGQGASSRPHEQARDGPLRNDGLGASSLDFELQFDVHSTDYEYVFATRSAICIEILEAFKEAGLDFAYPTQTTFTAAPDGTLVMPYAEVKTVATEEAGGLGLSEALRFNLLAGEGQNPTSSSDSKRRIAARSWSCRCWSPARCRSAAGNAARPPWGPVPDSPSPPNGCEPTMAPIIDRLT